MTGVDRDLRIRFLERLLATDFAARTGAPGAWEEDLSLRPQLASRLSAAGPGAAAAFPYLSTLAAGATALAEFARFAAPAHPRIGILTLNRYADETRLEGPWVHPLGRMTTFTPRASTTFDWWNPGPDELNTGQAFFVARDVSWAIYTFSFPPERILLMGDKEPCLAFFDAWPEGITHVVSTRPRPARSERRARPARGPRRSGPHTPD